MKKRLFTLFALGMMLSGVFSIAKAQTITIDSVTITNASNFSGGVIYETNYVSTNAPLYDVPSMYIRVQVSSTLQRDTIININTGGAAQYLGFPGTVVLPKTETQSIPYFVILTVGGDKKRWNMPNSVSGTRGTISVAVEKALAAKDTSFLFYNVPTISLKFYNPTVQFPGKLSFIVEGGDTNLENYSRYIYYTDGGYETQHLGLTKEFSESEIKQLQWNDTIIVYHQTTGRQAFALPLSNHIVNPNPGEGGLNQILRAVNVPALQNAYFKDLSKGTIFVASTKDLRFTIVPTGENVGKAPVLKTDRIALVGGEEVLGQTWTRERNADGSYTIVIKTIQEAFSILGFDFEKDDIANNDVIDNNNVWAANGQLYITSAVAANAKIYTVAGALVQTVALAAGETKNVALPAGFYVVTLNNSYKVIVQ